MQSASPRQKRQVPSLQDGETAPGRKAASSNIVQAI